MRGIAEALAAAGLTVELPLLPGHGTALEDMLETTWQDWSGAADKAYVDLAARCESVAVVGLSMGGSLSCFLAEQHPEIAGIVLINPLVEPPADDFRAAIKDLVDSGTPIAPGIGSDIAEPGVQELSYEGTPLAAALSLFAGVGEVAARLSSIDCPVLLFSSRDDHVVPPTNGDFLVEHLSGAIERIWLDRSYHVATLDYDRDEIESRTVSFVSAVTTGSEG
jgi:carboxylesterase